MAEETRPDEGDRLFLIAESLASDFSLFAERDTGAIEDHVAGLVSAAEIEQELDTLARLDTDGYCERCVAPAEAPGRTGARDVIARLGGRIEEEHQNGAFYAARLTLPFSEGPRPVGFICQDRTVRNGVWGPELHLAAARQVEVWCRRNIPIVTLMDTPGADAEEAANRNNQAHSISRLIAKMSNLDVPTIGIVLGLGYSGGAIPLATCNLVLSVREGVFNTIQPKGLANIARKYDLSWQECAKLVGVSAFELYQQGNIDGIVDYSPAEPDDRIDNLARAIITGIESIEQSTAAFVAANPYLMDHYRRSLQRYLSPSEQLTRLQSLADLSFTERTTTEFITVFGITFRYLRYLALRRRIRSTTIAQYGRLAEAEVPRGELADRTEQERQRAFLVWLQDPEKLVYDDTLVKAWRNYLDKREAAGDERGRIAQLIFGEPKKEYDQARAALVMAVTTYLYNRWKNEARGNFTALLEHLRRPEGARLLLRSADIADPRALLERLRIDEGPLASYLRQHLSASGRKLLSTSGAADRSEGYLREHLATELNVLLMARNPVAELPAVDAGDAGLLEAARSARAGSAEALRGARQLLAADCAPHLRLSDPATPEDPREATLLDVLLEDELREEFATACADMLIFDDLYDQVLANLDTIAAEADNARQLSFESMGALFERCLTMTAGSLARSLGLDADLDSARAVTLLRGKSLGWLESFSEHGEPRDFLKAVEEWKKSAYPHISDTLFVIVTEVFERLMPSYAQALEDPKRYDGRLNPRNIGRRKDFWNRLTIAYHDLQIQGILDAVKKGRLSHPQAIIERFFDGFDELYGDVISADPVSFPGFRVSIEQALARDITPCGVITGTASYRGRSGPSRCGVMVSNVDFQAGAFDMASAEKFCHLLVECARQRMPVVCFVSSGGMQTKEGAGSLYSMAVVNDRITRFVRDLSLPIVVFGFGDCTGGAQASFVTHPLVQTYYFSGTNMPFAGQIVVPANLPSRATLSNYLSAVQGAMRGLVRNPFQPDLDERLRAIDPIIPVAREDVEDVMERVISGMQLDAPAVPPEEYRAPDPASLIRPVRRTLIHARGCTAAKLIRVAQRLDIDIVLVQSDPDMDSLAVDMLGDRDQVVCIGGNTSDESYLNGLSVVRVAEHEQVDSLHPGIGFLSETSQFAELCRAHGINFIGPPVESMEAMGNKSNAITTARRLKVPVVPGSHGILTDIDRAAEVADQIGYPVLIKAVHGGGGKGIQVVEDPSQFHDLFRRVTVEARSAFGNGDIYLEKFVTSLRHIEAQLLRDTHGNTRVLGIRDCSVQRNKQKIVEESGSTMLPAALEAQVFEHTAAIAEEVGYVGAGTVEYIYDVANDAVYFMEMNTRLQVEHPVTEKVSGVDIVAEQFRIAGGESIAHLEAAQDGYSIEVRINAEKLVRDRDGRVSVRPDPGTVTLCEFPESDDIDVIPAIATGKTVSPFYDSLVAQIIVHGSDRSQAARRLAAYLDEVRIEGVCTNLALVKRILVDEVFLGGDYDTGFFEIFLDRIDVDALMEEIEATAALEGRTLDADALRIEGSDELKVLAPSSGIFYLTPSPSEPEYVSVGDQITAEQTLCQLEAMKLFTPLRLGSFNSAEADLYPSDRRYTVTRINIASGQQVNAGDLLFVVRPEKAVDSEAA